MKDLQKTGVRIAAKTHSIIQSASYRNCEDLPIVIVTSPHHVIGRLQEFRHNTNEWQRDDRTFCNQRRSIFSTPSRTQKEPPNSNQPQTDPEIQLHEDVSKQNVLSDTQLTSTSAADLRVF